MKERRMIRKTVVWLAALCLMLPALARAEAGEAVQMVKEVTEEVLSTLREDKDIRAGNTERAASLIENKVAPHFDFQRMTRLAIGSAWQKATPEQRDTLVKEFRTLLVRTYANAMTNYRDQKVIFKQASASNANGEVTVHSQVVRPGSQPVPVDYSLIQAAGDWKVFDVVISNISLVTNYRNNFTEEVSRGGVDGLIQSLHDKNRRLESNRTPASS
jgi:phospholipid transport system substrate-binding protein